jgi:hypothetical protein
MADRLIQKPKLDAKASKFILKIKRSKIHRYRRPQVSAPPNLPTSVASAAGIDPASPLDRLLTKRS